MYEKSSNIKIKELYLQFKKNPPYNLWNLNGQSGGCGVWALELFRYFKNKGYNPIVCELNKGVHYWVKVEEYVMDSKNIVYNKLIPSNEFLLYVTKQRITYFSDFENAMLRIKKYNKT